MIHQLIADVLRSCTSYPHNLTANERLVIERKHGRQADALLATPEFAIILDLAAMVTKMTPEIDRWMSDAEFHYAVSILLADWRASR